MTNGGCVEQQLPSAWQQLQSSLADAARVDADHGGKASCHGTRSHFGRAIQRGLPVIQGSSLHLTPQAEVR